MVEECVKQWLGPKVDQLFLVGVSGGRDSMCLLDCLLRQGARNLLVVHVNHGLRGTESDLDEALVREYCDKNSVPCEVEHADVGQRMTDSKEGLESSARALRLDVFAQIAQRVGHHELILGHHADDQAETVLHNLLRGSAGLRGIHEAKVLSDYELVIHRPLLGLSRLEINGYMESHKISYREDASNRDGFTVRNRIRAELLPLMEDIMGRNVSRVLCRSAAIEAERMESIREYLRELELYDSKGRLFLPKLKQLPTGFQKEAIHGYLREQSITNVTEEVITRCLSLLSLEGPAKINLPGNCWLRRAQQRLFIET